MAASDITPAGEPSPSPAPSPGSGPGHRERSHTGTALLTGPTRGLGSAAAEQLGRRHPGPLVLLGRPGERLAAAMARTEAAARAARRAGAEAGAGAGTTAGTGTGAAAGAGAGAGAGARAGTRAGTGAADVRATGADLARLAEVREAGREVAADVAAGTLAPLTTVVCNAGIQTTDRLQQSADGHELTFAVNVLSLHALLRALRPALAPGCRVVLLGSGTHYGDQSFGLIPPPRWEDPADLARPGHGDDADQTVAGGRAYATSKLAVLYLAHAWQRELGDVARVNVYDPGLMPGTGLARHAPAWARLVWSAVMPAMRVLPGVTSPRRSARHLVDLALGATHADAADAYVALGRVREPSAASRDRVREDRLWEVCEQLTATA